MRHVLICLAVAALGASQYPDRLEARRHRGHASDQAGLRPREASAAPPAEGAGAAAQPPRTGAAAARAPGDEKGDWAVYAGKAPWSARQGVFLIGDRWTPRAFDRVPGGLEVGSQGRLIWKNNPGGYPGVVHFDPAEVPLHRDDLLGEGAGDMPAWKGHSRAGLLLLVRAVLPATPASTKIVVGLGQRWYKDGSLSAAEWARLLRLFGQRKALDALAKADAGAAYEYVSLLFAEGRFPQARAVLQKREAAVEDAATRRHDTAETGCAPVRTGRDAEGGPAALATGLSWSQVLFVATFYGQGKKAEAERAARMIKNRSPRFLASVVCAPPAGAGGTGAQAHAEAAPGDPPEPELSEPERPRALIGRVPGFVALLQSIP